MAATGRQAAAAVALLSGLLVGVQPGAALTVYLRPVVLAAADSLRLDDVVQPAAPSTWAAATGQARLALPAPTQPHVAFVVSAPMVRDALAAHLPPPVVVIGQHTVLVEDASDWFVSALAQHVAARRSRDADGDSERWIEVRLLEAPSPMPPASAREQLQLATVRANPWPRQGVERIEFSYPTAAGVQAGIVEVAIRGSDQLAVAGQGMRPVDRVGAGISALPGMLRETAAVRGGQDVTVRFVRGNVLVTMRGTALRGATVGSPVQVRAGTDRTRFDGVATGDGEVTVALR